MLAAIELYNKPNFPYRDEAFAVLCVNAWELLIKAYWLKLHNNRLASLYVTQSRKNKGGRDGKKIEIKRSRSNNPMTHSIGPLAEQLVATKHLEKATWANIDAIVEIRDTAIHFYNKSAAIQTIIYELSSASVRNFFEVAQTWFDVDTAKYNWFLMPLSFVKPLTGSDAIVTAKEEGNLLAFVRQLGEAANDPNEKTNFSIKIKLDFVRAKGADAIAVAITNDRSAVPVYLDDTQIRQRYPLSYEDVAAYARGTYPGFKQNHKFNEIIAAAKKDAKYSMVRELDPGNPKTSKKNLYSEAIRTLLDIAYLGESNPR